MAFKKEQWNDVYRNETYHINHVKRAMRLADFKVLIGHPVESFTFDIIVKSFLLNFLSPMRQRRQCCGVLVYFRMFFCAIRKIEFAKKKRRLPFYSKINVNSAKMQALICTCLM